MKKFEKICLIFGFLACLSVCNFTMAEDWNLPGVTIISRSERGADESIRLLKAKKISTATTQTEAQIKAANISKIRNARMAKNYPNDWKYEGSRTMSGDMYLIYPEYFNYHKTKIVIHHTAMDYDPNWTFNDVKKHLQGIYRYHTLNRSFGDIGYNFLIDQLGNIYEGRSGGQGAVGMHAANNNASSVGIALLGNFENDVPTEAQLSALINLTTALAKYYNIDPNGTTYTFQINTLKEPYVVAEKNPNIMGHGDIKATACPGKNLDSFLPKLRDEVAFRLKNGITGEMPLPSSWISELNRLKNGTNSASSTTNVINNQVSNISTNTATNTTANSTTEINLSSIKTDGTFSERLKTLQEKNPNLISKLAQKMRENYKGKLTVATNSMNKIEKRYSIDDAKKMINQNISVLLYELTTKYDSFEIQCQGVCIFNIDGMNYYWTGATLTFLSNSIQVKSDRNLSANSVSVQSSVSGGTVEVSNYNRKSYAGIPWNIFKGKLTFEKGTYPTKNGEQKSDFIVVNTLPFAEYMKGIVETNDTETLEKNKVMAMISKNYALFYLNGDNIHPSIDKNASYTAIDDPDFFQKYVGAGLEKTLTKRYQALNETMNEVVMYDNYLPILPYFSCSAGFTLSAQEKRGWNDTPYLQSVFDFEYCNNFAGHGVGLAGKGAERFAKNGMKYDQILKYYYDGIEIKKIN